MKFARSDVPLAFCEKYCCTWIAGYCRMMTDGCGWTARQAVQAMERKREWMSRELFSWEMKLKREEP